MKFTSSLFLSLALIATTTVAYPGPERVTEGISDIEAAKYRIHCSGGLSGSCYHSPNKCDSYGVYHSKDQNCRSKCGCQR
jgi:hypothetical protein